MKLAISPFCDQVDQIDLYLVENLIQALYIFVKIHLRLSVIFQSLSVLLLWKEEERGSDYSLVLNKRAAHLEGIQ